MMLVARITARYDPPWPIFAVIDQHHHVAGHSPSQRARSVGTLHYRSVMPKGEGIMEHTTLLADLHSNANTNQPHRGDNSR
jgi:hypothetical protein